jgi:hypothetical protein
MTLMNTKVTNNNLDSDEGSIGTLDSNTVFGSEGLAPRLVEIG